MFMAHNLQIISVNDIYFIFEIYKWSIKNLNVENQEIKKPERSCKLTGSPAQGLKTGMVTIQ